MTQADRDDGLDDFAVAFGGGGVRSGACACHPTPKHEKNIKGKPGVPQGLGVRQAVDMPSFWLRRSCMVGLRVRPL